MLGVWLEKMWKTTALRAASSGFTKELSLPTRQCPRAMNSCLGDCLDSIQSQITQISTKSCLKGHCKKRNIEGVEGDSLLHWVVFSLVVVRLVLCETRMLHCGASIRCGPYQIICKVYLNKIKACLFSGRKQWTYWSAFGFGGNVSWDSLQRFLSLTISALRGFVAGLGSLSGFGTPCIFPFSQGLTPNREQMPLMSCTALVDKSRCPKKSSA